MQVQKAFASAVHIYPPTTSWCLCRIFGSIVVIITFQRPPLEGFLAGTHIRATSHFTCVALRGVTSITKRLHHYSSYRSHI